MSWSFTCYTILFRWNDSRGTTKENVYELGEEVSMLFVLSRQCGFGDTLLYLLYSCS